MIAASKVKTRLSNLAEDSALSFAKQMDDYIKSSTVSKAIVKAFNTAVVDIIKAINKEIALPNEASAKANDIEQYSRRNNIRIFGLADTEGEDCYNVVLNFARMIWK